MKTKVPVQEWAPPREAGMIQNIEAKSISRTTGKDECQNSRQKVRAGWFLGYNWKRLCGIISWRSRYKAVQILVCTYGYSYSGSNHFFLTIFESSHVPVGK